ncbi:MAG: hypothetical protein EHM45_11685 [Desulfobacteraceae bacterium]|nr:MAG: hypothetical protein EHM45_11685 [Desulfobacteraceae bacterium]
MKNKTIFKTNSGIFYFTIICMLFVVMNFDCRAKENQWPSMAEFDLKIGIEARSEKIYFEIPLRDIRGRIQYTLICRGGSVEYLNAFTDSNKILYAPDLGFRLYEGTKEVEGSLLCEDGAPAWHSRGQVRYSQLVGACGKYPEYGMLRHFRLRGFELTLEFFDIVIDPEGKPAYLNLRISLHRYPKAISAQAGRPGYLSPEAEGRSCEKVLKGKDPLMRRNKQGSWYKIQE